MREVTNHTFNSIVQNYMAVLKKKITTIIKESDLSNKDISKYLLLL